MLNEDFAEQTLAEIDKAAALTIALPAEELTNG